MAVQRLMNCRNLVLTAACIALHGTPFLGYKRFIADLTIFKIRDWIFRTHGAAAADSSELMESSMCAEFCLVRYLEKRQNPICSLVPKFSARPKSALTYM